MPGYLLMIQTLKSNLTVLLQHAQNAVMGLLGNLKRYIPAATTNRRLNALL